ncbi:hypothetical protein BN997_00204 [Oceanobacillus oncorhynchi]|uniref:2-dehydro-3-deoxy-phosphogluconate aldolase n=1 Tax=Oceanobacillus oncorhynchi TaxID=545501 RepID=A0A0A1MMT6_9BACI|nr:KDGP aldolase family protein [Oceanobacillus oncorhynchi]CEI80401.1 hypothetical protein BN997_00204 [Oceanobacillus oncorhynchi]
MKKIDKFFYKDRVALNVLANSIENAKEVYEAGEGKVLIGVLSKNYDTVEEAVSAMGKYDEAIHGAVSIGLGAGDNRQAAVVENIVKSYEGSHINQVFPSVGATRANLGEKESWINALVSPSGKVGYVTISTGPLSSNVGEQAVVPIESAIALMKDMGGHALKFFPMKGLAHQEEFRAVAKACAEADFALEPTGGIDLNNFEEILTIALEAGVPKVIPHVYSSIIDKETGKTNIEDVKKLLDVTKQLVSKYA